MFPEPVETVSSTRPFTWRLRSNVASVASAGRAASEIAAATTAIAYFIALPLKNSGQ
jgi:hypothetical protein